jgi:glycosyltransferase involved in cell wall biosynthesis
VVPHASDVSRFQRSYEPLDQLKPHKDAGEFLFYTVGEFTRRKNLAALVKSFHLEFDPSEPVRLVIKTGRPGASPAEAKAQVEDYCREIRRGLKLHGGELGFYTPEVVITDRLTETGMMRLHAGCDVFVQPSHGEAWSIPAFDAMGMGKTPIVTDCGGYAEYVSDETGWLVTEHSDHVFGVTDTFEDLFVGDETWSVVSIRDLRKCMRRAYEDGRLREELASNGISRAFDFSHEVVGGLLKAALESSHDREALDRPAGPVRDGPPGRPA